jgi:hypothetical protein
MQHHPNKCKVLQIATRTPLQSNFTIHGQVLNNGNSAKYLGLNIHKTLSLGVHINEVTQKAHNTLPFPGRNISRWPTNIKDQYYSTLARSSLECTFTNWSPVKNYSISQIKAVQRRVVRFASGDYRRTNSVMEMMDGDGSQT